jgi:nucleoside recognition membrane protein YjiH
MKAYFIIFVVIFSIAFIAGMINHLAGKRNPKSLTANISSMIANGFGIIVVFMLFGGLLCIC